MLTVKKGRPITLDWYVMRPPNRQPVLFTGMSGDEIRITVTGPGGIPFGPLTYLVCQNPDTGHQYLSIMLSDHETGILETGIFSILLQWDKTLNDDGKPVYRKLSQLEGVFALTDVWREDNTGIAQGLEVRKVLRSYEEKLTGSIDLNIIPTQSELAELIDRIESSHTMVIRQSRNGFVLYGEDETVEIVIYDGFGLDVTQQYHRFYVERQSGDEASDRIWNAEHTNVGTTFTILFTDLRIDYVTTRTNTFRVTGVKGDDEQVSALMTYEY